MASHKVSCDHVVKDVEDRTSIEGCALKLVTGFLDDVSIRKDGKSPARFSRLDEHDPGSDDECGRASPMRNGSMDWTMWQLVDSLFPTGGFAHSHGLESAFQVGSVHDSVSLEKFAINALQNSAALLLPFIFAGNKLPNTECWLELNRILHSTLTNHIARKASLTQGSALLRTGVTVFTELPELQVMRKCTYAPRATNPHHAPLFGVLCGLLGVDASTSQRAYLFLALRDIMSAGTRLNVTGPLEAAKLQHRIARVTETFLTRYANRPIQEAHATSPLLDIFQGGHDHLFSRMFCS